MAKTGNVRMFRIWIMFLCAVVAASLIMGIATISFAAKKTLDGSAAIVDINTADEKTLESLPGVGKATAKAIVAGRPYKSVDDLKRVKGMSDKKIQALKGKISVGGAAASTATAAASQKVTAAEKKASDTTAAASQKVASAEKSAVDKSSKTTKKLAPGQRININSASKEDLQALPGIGPAKAQAVIDARPYDKPEDIMKVKGIKQKTFDKLKDYITVR
jgi:competence protein ComEA